mmetsp:Transcript_24172/g.72604  ORF Transcript_24172/g.72604 Transcript_24172/m.72604 type:complete len:201 (+) Transcript_24172:185-787(+)
MHVTRRAGGTLAAHTCRRRSPAGGVGEVPANLVIAEAEVHDGGGVARPVLDARPRAAADAQPMRLGDLGDPRLLEPAIPLLARRGLPEIERRPVVGHPQQAGQDEQAAHKGESPLQRLLPLEQLGVLSDDTAQQQPSHEAADVARVADALPIQGGIDGIRHEVDRQEQEEHPQRGAGKLLLLPIQEQVCQVSPQQRVATA